MSFLYASLCYTRCTRSWSFVFPLAVVYSIILSIELFLCLILGSNSTSQVMIVTALRPRVIHKQLLRSLMIHDHVEYQTTMPPAQVLLLVILRLIRRLSPRGLRAIQELCRLFLLAIFRLLGEVLRRQRISTSMIEPSASVYHTNSSCDTFHLSAHLQHIPNPSKYQHILNLIRESRVILLIFLIIIILE